MKLQPLLLATFLAATTTSPQLHAQLFASSPILNQTIPDGDLVGLSHNLTISAPLEFLVTDITVGLHLTGESVGDLYGQLFHDGHLAVLLNRVGRTSGNLFGYDDTELDIDLNDSASNGDVHNYRLKLSGDPNTPLTGPLTGTWAPDGRNTNPTAVLDTSSRTATLSSLSSFSANGVWTLFLADVDPGSENRLVDWGLQITVIPEPPTAAAISALLCLRLALVARDRRARPTQLN